MSKVKSKNPTKPFTLRGTDEQLKKLYEKADALGMPYTTYAADKLFNGKERKRHTRNKIGTSLIKTNNAIDSLLNQTLQEDSISKDKLISSLESIREELNSICKL